jgi:hypothetical protein
MLATKTEIIAIAFSRPINPTKILDSLIEATQYRYIKPVLGEDLYYDLVAAPTNPLFSPILQYVKNALAWMVKYRGLPELFVEISDMGAHQISVNNASIVTDARFIEIKAATVEMAEIHMKILADFLFKNPITAVISGHNYNPGKSEIDISDAGGILVNTHKSFYNDSDMEPMYWNRQYWMY